MESVVLERVYQLLLAAGYPASGVDWLRQHRLTTIVLMAIAAWALFIGLGWLIWLALT
ncbi:hypothetical protein [Devosia nitrariae]|uniref:hypothetical protein n=1 Tax=Devosia nitrariae TaxID=2071872 RepID=UPI0024E12A9D|nr:hypothetical protein [Devosia nitrariae]